MTMQATGIAMAAKVGPHEKLLLIRISDSLDDLGNYRREWLPRLREWAGLSDEEMTLALMRLQQAGWWSDAVDAEGFACLQFTSMADATLNPQWHKGKG